MRTSVESLEGNKVKLSVEVDEAEFERAVDDAFRRIAREVRIPGFRPGKAPRRVLEARIGSEVARQEALREALPGYLARAITEHEVDAIAPPEVDITAGEEAGAVAFDAVVEVRPRVAVPGYANLRVTVPRPTVTAEEVDAQIDRMRAQHGELVTVERAARDGDHVSIDIQGSQHGEPLEQLTADDYLYEVGSGGVVPELDDQLRGARPGDILQFDAQHPDPDEDGLSFRVLVKEVKEQRLPEATDEWAAEASELQTLDELRADIERRYLTIKRVQAQMILRDQVVEAVTDLVEEDAPEPLVQSEMAHRAEDLVRRLAAQGASVEQYLAATGRDQQELTDELRATATRAVLADLALRAVADAEDIEVTEEDLDREIARVAERSGEKPAAIRRQLERDDLLPAVRSDIRKGKALEWLIEHVEIVDDEGQPIDRSELEVPRDEGSSTEEPAEEPAEEEAE